MRRPQGIQDTFDALKVGNTIYIVAAHVCNVPGDTVFYSTPVMTSGRIKGLRLESPFIFVSVEGLERENMMRFEWQELFPQKIQAMREYRKLLSLAKRDLPKVIRDKTREIGQLNVELKAYKMELDRCREEITKCGG